MRRCDFKFDLSIEPGARMNSVDLHDHIHKTYHSLRIGLAALALILPFLLVGYGFFLHGITMRGSMSEYYFAFAPETSHERTFPMRTWFVGILWAIGSFLVLYRGFSQTENWLLNFAGLSAIAIAVIHMQVPDYCKNCGSHFIAWWPSAHAVFAIAFFVFMAWVAWACSGETLGELDPPTQERYRKIYDSLAISMIAAPLAVFAGSRLLRLEYWQILLIEAVGVWLFSAYWIVKSREIRLSDADKKAVDGAVTRKREARSAQQGSLRGKAGRIFDRKRD